MQQGSLRVLMVLGGTWLGCQQASVDAPAGSPSAGPAPQRSVVTEATFDDLKFEMADQDQYVPAMLTPKVQSLAGKRLRIRGYIYPTLKKKGLKQFVLVRDNLECCFGPGAALYDCILVHMNAGKTAEYSIRPVAVQGKFTLEEFLDYDGTIRAIYRLDGESVE
jgi:hypothetical protein